MKLKINLQTNFNDSLFQAVFFKILNEITPVKVKVLRFNSNIFMAKSLRKVIMLRCRFENDFSKKRSNENWDNYEKQRNFCVKLLGPTKEKYFSYINVKIIFDNKIFFEKPETIFFNKGQSTNNIMFVEINKIVRVEEIIANIMNNCFTNMTTHLKLKPTKTDPSANLKIPVKVFMWNFTKSWKCSQD